MDKINLRLAKRKEINWINQCYDEIDFIHSNFDNEIIVIAEVGSKKTGIGRLVIIDDKNFELGGIYVFEAFRNKGYAKYIVNFLLTFVKPNQTVYCIPFEHLISFYKKCGFSDCTSYCQVPKKILDKYNFCKNKYTKSIALLFLEK
jgi:GNAT superfamily N-acetyltransferase